MTKYGLIISYGATKATTKMSLHTVFGCLPTMVNPLAIKVPIGMDITTSKMSLKLKTIMAMILVKIL